jgi:alpha-galactosidase
LIFGGNLPDNNEFTLSLITNNEVLAVDQNSYNNHEVLSDSSLIVWSANIPNSKDFYLAVFNITDKNDSQIILKWEKLGLNNKVYKVRDLWSKTDLGNFENSISLSVNSHGARLLKLSE